MSVDSEVVLQILRRSSQGFTPFEILERLLAQPQYQDHSRGSIFAQLLPVLQSLRDFQVVAHVSPRWVLVEPIETTSVKLSEEIQDANNSEQDDKSEALIIQHQSEENLDSGFRNKAGKTANFTLDSKQENISYVVKAPLDFPIELLLPNLSMRAYHGLKRAGINTIEALHAWSEQDLLSIKNFGQKSLDEVRVALAKFQPPPQSAQNQKVIQLPEWATIPGLQIHTRCVSLSPSLHQLVSKYPTIAHLIYDFENGGISLDSHQYAELKFVISPFQALRDASQGYLAWLASLSSLTLIEVLTKHQWTPERLKELSPRQILSAISLDARATTHQAIISGEIPSKHFATIAEEIDDWFSTLDDKPKFILKQRLGLSNGKPRSLEDIGQELGLTRERVRQIEQKAKNIPDYISNGIFLQLRQIVIETLHSLGCISTLPNWCEAIAELYPPGEVHLQSVVTWLLDWVTGFHSIQIGETKLFYNDPVTSLVVEDIQAQVVDFWKEQRISDREQLHQVILPLLPEQIPNTEKVADILISAFCHEPLPSLFSAERWNVTDYAYYVLHEAGKPLHFSEVGQRIKQLKPDWKAENIERAAQGAIERHPDIIRCGSGIYGLREWGTVEYSHMREVLLDYLSEQPLPIDAEVIYTDISQFYEVTPATINMNLSFYPNLFQKFGRSNIYGVKGRRYELPDQNLIDLLVAKLELGPANLANLIEDADFHEYRRETIHLYLNVSPLLSQISSNRDKKFALSIAGKCNYEPGDAPDILEDVFNQIREPLNTRDFPRIMHSYYAYTPTEGVFWRVLTGSHSHTYIPVAEGIFIPRSWMTDEIIGPILEYLDIDLFRRIVLFTLSTREQRQPTPILFDWLNFCYQNRFFYRGSLIYHQIDLSKLPEKQAEIARKIGRVCQRNGDISVLGLGQDANNEEIERTLRLDLEDLRQQAQSVQRTRSKGLASKPDGKYRVRYVGVGVEVQITKWGGTADPRARVLQVLVNGEPYEPSRHSPIPNNTATLDKRREALQKLYAATLTAYAQIDPYLQVAIGSRPSWGSVGYRNLEPLTESEPGDNA